MNTLWNKLWCVILSLALLLNLLPASALATETPMEQAVVQHWVEDPPASATEEKTQPIEILSEDTSKRGEYYKEFVLNNGLRMASLYAEPVHYSEDGQWKEIDNTLKLSNGTYINTAGKWQVSFPQQLTKDKAVTITKDGYTLSFFMAGELYQNTTSMTKASLGTAAQEQPVQLQSFQTATAQLQAVKQLEPQVESKYPQAPVEKSHARLEYANVSTNTDIVYDLNSNQVKESIVMEAYSARLRGYRYTLNVGKLHPVLTDSGEINLYDRDNKEIVMVMPAPFLVDDAGEYCYDVELTLIGSGSQYTLTYLLPQQWLADAERQWPVVLDPVVNADITRTNIRDVSVYERNKTSNNNDEYLDVGYNPEYGVMRSYIKYAELPELNSADVIVNAQLKLTINATTDNCIIEACKVLETWESESTTWSTKPDINNTVEDYAIVNNGIPCYMTITDIVRGWYDEENTGLALKVPQLVETSASSETYMTHFFSSDFIEPLRPQLTVYFRNTSGLESYWDYTVSSAGRAGTGYVNNYSGNLVWVHSDMSYGGNRMPVSISHIFNSNDKAKNTFGAGYGWRTNYNQTLTYYPLEDGEAYYIWEDADGTKHCFNKNDAGVYEDEDGLGLTLTQDDDLCICMIKDKDDNTYYFDYYGRLYMLENNQQEPSCIQIDYTTSDGLRISKITDGAGRVYRFDYNSGFITKIRYLGMENSSTSESDVVDYVSYEYSNGCLSEIIYRDGETSLFTYYNNHALDNAQDIDGYKLTYGYTSVGTGKPARVGFVQETESNSSGGLILFYYSYNQTKLLDNLSNIQIKQFNNWGNLISVQDEEGRTQFIGYESNDQSDGGKGNRLITSSKMQNTVSNLLNNGSFENNIVWGTFNGSAPFISVDYAYHGNCGIKVVNNSSNTDAGIQSGSFYAAPGETYTFSAYVKTGPSGSAYITLGEAGSPEVSETLASGQDWTRLQVSYTNNQSTTVAFTARVYSTSQSYIYVDCLQLEKAETASRYNLIENGDFRYGADHWSKSEDCNSGEQPVVVRDVATPTLNENVFMMCAAPYEELRLQQTVNVSGSAGDTFVLGGWARGNTVPKTYEFRSFSLRGTFIYTDQSTEDSEFVFDYNHDTNDWQYISGAMVAKKAYSAIKVEILYEYNANEAYFDGIQLFKEEFGNSYTYDEEGKIISVKDLQGKITEYEYASNNADLLEIIQDNKAKVTYEYDAWHNVTKATTAEGVVYEFTYDTYGNNTSVSITSGAQTITSTATYTSDGNRLVSTTDALGKMTTYSYHPETNVLAWVKYPMDTDATKTVYSYDEMYRISQTAVTTDTGLNLSAEYTYDNDLLTSIETASTIYNFTYEDFALRSSVMVGTRKLADYSYYSVSHRPEKLEYSNDDMVQYTYDKQGRITQKTYEDDSYVTYKYDNSGALAKVYDSQSGITTTYYYDFTDRLMKYVEQNGAGTHSVSCRYDDINNLTGLVETINSIEHTTSYTYDDDNRVTCISNDGRSRSYTYDTTGRVSQDDTRQYGTKLFDRNYVYRGSSSQLYRLVYDGTNFSKSFNVLHDNNGRIVAMNDGTYSSSFVYDSANQLTRENNRETQKTTLWTYDDAGNILKREVYPIGSDTSDPSNRISEVNYTYGEDDWGDLLTAYNGVPITYDEIGNPLNDGTWTYTWQHGRQLASMSRINQSETWQFTYNADGLRTQRTNGALTYCYTYVGGQLSHMTVNGNTMYFAYDAAGVPLALTYNGVNYYYVTNLQGDVVAILNSSGTEVVHYSYDAWGNLISTTGTLANPVGSRNPLRYRGYVYDTETGFYYVSSRYYDPEIGRWISAELGEISSISAGISAASVCGVNAYTFCSNNPFNVTELNESANVVKGKATSSSTNIPAAQDTKVHYNVPLYNQNGYSLCWAFCQVMIEDYRAGINRTNTEATDAAIMISISVNGSDWNRGGWPLNASNPLGEYGKEPPSLTNLYFILLCSGPVYAYYGGNTGAHLVVVTGVNLSKGTVYTNNPWGIAGEQTYGNFLDGFIGMPTPWDMPFGFIIYPDL